MLPQSTFELELKYVEVLAQKINDLDMLDRLRAFKMPEKKQTVLRFTSGADSMEIESITEEEISAKKISVFLREYFETEGADPEIVREIIKNVRYSVPRIEKRKAFERFNSSVFPGDERLRTRVGQFYWLTESKRISPIKRPELDEFQRAALNSTYARNYIHAGPGAGKTSAMIIAAAEQIELNPNSRIVFVSFTVAAMAAVSTKLKAFGVPSRDYSRITDKHAAGIFVLTLDKYAYRRTFKFSRTNVNDSISYPRGDWENFDLAIIDEAQDIDGSKAELAFQIIENSSKAFVVGDPRQTLYYSTSLFDLVSGKKDFKRYVFRYNYRSTPEIVSMLNVFSNEHFSRYGLHETQFPAPWAEDCTKTGLRAVKRKSLRDSATYAIQETLDIPEVFFLVPVSVSAFGAEKLINIIRQTAHENGRIANVLERGKYAVDGSSIAISNSYRIKGLECDVSVLDCFDVTASDFPGGISHQKLACIIFVALSRARRGVYLGYRKNLKTNGMFSCIASQFRIPEKDMTSEASDNFITAKYEISGKTLENVDPRYVKTVTSKPYSSMKIVDSSGIIDVSRVNVLDIVRTTIAVSLVRKLRDTPLPSFAMAVFNTKDSHPGLFETLKESEGTPLNILEVRVLGFVDKSGLMDLITVYNRADTEDRRAAVYVSLLVSINTGVVWNMTNELEVSVSDLPDVILGMIDKKTGGAITLYQNAEFRIPFVRYATTDVLVDSENLEDTCGTVPTSTVIDDSSPETEVIPSSCGSISFTAPIDMGTAVIYIDFEESDVTTIAALHGALSGKRALVIRASPGEQPEVSEVYIERETALLMARCSIGVSVSKFAHPPKGYMRIPSHIKSDYITFIDVETVSKRIVEFGAITVDTLTGNLRDATIDLAPGAIRRKPMPANRIKSNREEDILAGIGLSIPPGSKLSLDTIRAYIERNPGTYVYWAGDESKLLESLGVLPENMIDGHKVFGDFTIMNRVSLPADLKSATEVFVPPGSGKETFVAHRALEDAIATMVVYRGLRER